MQTQIRLSRADSFLKINKRACTSIRHTRAVYKIRLDANTWKKYKMIDRDGIEKKGKKKELKQKQIETIKIENEGNKSLNRKVQEEKGSKSPNRKGIR